MHKGRRQKLQHSNTGVKVEASEAVEAVEDEAAAEPEEARAEEIFRTRMVPRVRTRSALASGQPVTPGGRDPDTLTYLPSTRARSTGTGESLQDSVKSHGRVHGRSSTVNPVTNETGTSPVNHQ